MKKITLLLLLMTLGVAQNILITVDHPVYHFLERQESYGHINAEFWSTRPYTYSQVNNMLDQVREHSTELSEMDLKVLARFRKDFDRIIKDEGINPPWSTATIQKLIHPAESNAPALFITYSKDDVNGWVSWSETFRLQNNGKASRAYNTDYVEVSGSKGRIDFTTQYIFHRITRNDNFDELPDTYKEGYVLDRDYMRWINWGYPTSSLTYTHPDFTIGIHRQPVYWGYSKHNSPILSNNVNPLPYVEWTTEMPHIRFKFMHARLTPNAEMHSDTMNVRRNLSAHRVEFDISPSFEFAFNEFVVYAHRDFELGYLNPVNFLFAEEQTQGDLDNKLMALDFKWRLVPGLTSYGTWFFDELDFWKLFSGWWGNKFVFQLGATYYPKANLPSINIEYTAARPWTYSHKNPINSFTSGGQALGLPMGPNTSNLSVSSNWQFNSKLDIGVIYQQENRYTGEGSDILEAYSYIELEENPSEGFWNGQNKQMDSYYLIARYDITQSLGIGIEFMKESNLTTTLVTRFSF